MDGTDMVEHALQVQIMQEEEDSSHYPEWLPVVIQEGLLDGGHAIRVMSKSARATFDGINKRLSFKNAK